MWLIFLKEEQVKFSPRVKLVTLWWVNRSNIIKFLLITWRKIQNHDVFMPIMIFLINFNVM